MPRKSTTCCDCRPVGELGTRFAELEKIRNFLKALNQRPEAFNTVLIVRTRITRSSHTLKRFR